MSQFLKKIALFCVVMFSLNSPAMAQEEGASPTANHWFLTTTIGAGLIVIGGGFGISKLASAAFESMARQPEVAGDIRGAMIIVAAMVEGAAVIALIVCFVKG